MSIEEQVENINPKLFGRVEQRITTLEEEAEEVTDIIDEREVFDIIRNINDPEHPLSLEELNVVELSKVKVNIAESFVLIEYTPTIPHCSMATIIGLSIRVCLLRSLPSRLKVDVQIAPGTHASESAINKQLADKERVAAALENNNLLEVVNQCLNSRS